MYNPANRIDQIYAQYFIKFVEAFYTNESKKTDIDRTEIDMDE